MAWYSKAVVAVLFAWLAAPVTVTAQLAKPEFGVAAGATFPTGDFYSFGGFKTGWQGMAFVASRIRHSPVAVRVDASYGANTSNDPINGVPTETRVKLFGEDADLTLTFPVPPRATAYVLAGPGLYSVSESVTQYGSTGSSPKGTKFAYNLGGGFTVGALFFEVRYVHVDGFGNGFSYILVPITAGVRFGSW